MTTTITLFTTIHKAPLIRKILCYFPLLFIISQTVFGQTCKDAQFIYPSKKFYVGDTNVYLPRLIKLHSSAGLWAINPSMGAMGGLGEIKPANFQVGTYSITHTINDTCSFTFSLQITDVKSLNSNNNSISATHTGNNSYDTPPYTVQSPNVANLGLHGSTPISYFTGKPSISVAFGNISNEKITVPLTVDYDASGLRPDVHPSVVGMNWSLNTGGVISKTIKGFSDDWLGSSSVLHTYGFLLNQFSNGNSYPNAWTSSSSIKTIANNAGFPDDNYMVYDGEPDEYNFKVLGYSGKFYPYYENFQLKWGVQSDNNIKIEIINDNGNTIGDYIYPPFTPQNINNAYNLWTYAYYDGSGYHYEPHLKGFRLTDEQGVVYEFNGAVNNSVEYSISFFDQGADTWLPTAWHLTKIKHPNGQEISFSYSRGDFVTQMYGSYNAVAETTGNFKSPVGNPSYSCSSGSSSGDVLANNGAGFIDGKLISPVYLSQISSPNSTASFLYENSTELRYENDLFQPKFDYLLIHDSRSGQAGNYAPYLFMPYLHQNFYPSFNYSALVNESNSNSNVSYYLSKLNWKKLKELHISSTDASFSKKFAFTYNDNSNQRLRLEKIEEVASDGTKLPAYEFSYHFPSGYALPNYLKSHTDHWNFNNGLLINNIQFPNFSPFSSYGDVYRSPTNDNNVALLGVLNKVKYPTGGYTEFYFEQNTFSKVVNLDRQSVNNFASNQRGGGLRISQMKDYDALGGVVTRTYNYNDGAGLSTGVSANKFEYYWANYYAELEDGSPYQMRKFSNSSLIPQYESGLGAMIGYTSVKESIAGQGYTQYDFSNLDNNSYADDTPLNTLNQLNVVYRPFSSHALKRGKLVLKQYFNQAGTLVNKTEYKYKEQGDFINGNLESYVKIIDSRTHQYCNTDNRLYEGSAYKVFTYKYLPIEELVTTYDENNASEYSFNFKRYSYKANGQLNKLAVIADNASPGLISLNYNGSIPIGPWYYEREIHISYTYPNDYPSDATMTAMSTKNMINYPVETKIESMIVGGNQLYYTPLKKEKISYNYFNTKFYQPSKVEIQFAYNNWQTPLEFLSYDNEGHLTTFSEWGTGKRYLDYFSSSNLGKVGLLKESSKDDGSNNANLRAIQKLSYDYSPLRGVNNILTANGLYTRFDFDNFGRLSTIKDHNNFLVQKYGYQYAQSGSSGCTTPTAPNISVSNSGICDVTLSASACSGTVNWSNGATGNSISVNTNTTTTYTATCTVAGCSSGNSNSIVIPTLPTNWVASNIGNPPTASCVQYDGSTWTLQSTGNTYDVSDNFNFVYQSSSGNAVMVAQLNSVSVSSTGVRSGIMLRANTTPTAPYYQFFYDSGYGVLSLYVQDGSTGDGQIGYQVAGLPKWLRLKKNGSDISAWYSDATSPAWNNDADWTLYTTVNSTAFDSGFLMGLLAYNNGYSSNNLVNQTQFSHVSINNF